jgi:6-phosphogluconolactonase
VAEELRDRIPWSSVHVFWSDERYVPPDHPDSNVRMAREALLDAVPLPPRNLHLPDTTLSNPDEAAQRYEEEIGRHLRGGACLDWVLLGLGDDGHVASLFPGSPALGEEQRWVVAVRASPKPPPTRLTMTPPILNSAREIHFLVQGHEKAEALGTAVSDSSLPPRLPAQAVRPQTGRITWWVDAAAASRLRRFA